MRLKKQVTKEAPAEKQGEAEAVKKRPDFQLVRGMRDILPSEQKYWRHVVAKAEEIGRGYGFGKINTPILEHTQLFIKGVGKTTDIVEKEMYSFVDQGGDNLTLRPEFTAGVARAYIEHGMLNLPQPVKLYSFGPVFRHERPQAGRNRQFHQVNFEIIGDSHPVLDAQLILLGHNIYSALGLPVSVQINSLGDDQCRPQYREALVNYYRPKRKNLCDDCKARLTRNPLRLLDCKNEQCQPFKEEAPQMVDWLCDECKHHFMQVLEYLDEVEVFYELNPQIVRGLDYYTRTAFEFFMQDEEFSRRTELGGGGRYDKLIEQLGGRPTPAVGWAMGIERAINRIKEKGIAVPEERAPEVFLAQLGDQAKKRCMILFEQLRKEGFQVVESFSKDNLKSQLEIAGKVGVKLVLVLGQKELLDGTIMIRDMEAGVQEVIDYNKIIAELKKRLTKV